MRRSVAIAVAAAGLVAAACADRPERAELAAYEARLETFIAEEEGIAKRLDEFRKDLNARNAEAAELPAYARETAGPFYRRFEEEALAMEIRAERLRAAHRKLLDFIAARRAHIGAALTVLEGTDTRPLEEVAATERAFLAARKALAAASTEPLAEVDVLDALQVFEMFQAEPLVAFVQDRRTAAQVENDVRTAVLPRLQKVADRTAGSLDAPGLQGAIARWAAAGVAHGRALVAWFPAHERTRTLVRNAEQSWDDAVKGREAYLAALAAYRESLR